MIYHLNDVEADFRAFYGLTPADVARMSGPHFLALAWRLPAYSGAVAGRMAAYEQEGQARHDGSATVIDSTPAAIRTNTALSDVIDYG